MYVSLVAFATLFGAWEGGLYGVAAENKKLTPFHEDIEAGNFLFLIYTQNSKIGTVKSMMSSNHPESEHVATDQHFLSPFSEVRRERRTAV